MAPKEITSKLKQSRERDRIMIENIRNITALCESYEFLKSVIPTQMSVCG